MMNNAEALFGVSVGGATSSPAMRVAYGSDGTPVYKSIHHGSSPSPYHQQQQQPSSATTGGGNEVAPEAAMHGLNMNVVEGGSDHQQQQQQQQQQHPPMAMMMKKKRGRPRKYGGVGGGTDGTMSLALTTTTAAVGDGPPPPQAATASGGAFSPPSGEGRGGSSPGSSFKKARGRPPSSTNKTNNKNHQHTQPFQLGSAGFGFTPHVISVKAGEDVSSKIMSFSQNGPRAVCILSANGAISNVTLRQAATSGGTATFEGRFEILSLCGSFLLTEVGGQRSRTGGLSMSLAGPDGRVLGGCVAGLLTAASPVQVIVGSFITDGKKEPKALNHHTDPTHLPSPQNPMPMSMQPMLFQGSGGHAAAPTAGVSESSQGGSFSESSGGEGSSPPNHSTGDTAASNHHHHNNNNNNINHPQGLMGMPWR